MTSASDYRSVRWNNAWGAWESEILSFFFLFLFVGRVYFYRVNVEKKSLWWMALVYCVFPNFLVDELLKIWLKQSPERVIFWSISRGRSTVHLSTAKRERRRLNEQLLKTRPHPITTGSICRQRSSLSELFFAPLHTDYNCWIPRHSNREIQHAKWHFKHSANKVYFFKFVSNIQLQKCPIKMDFKRSPEIKSWNLYINYCPRETLPEHGIRAFSTHPGVCFSQSSNIVTHPRARMKNSRRRTGGLTWNTK